MNRILGIRFQEVGKVYHFRTDDDSIGVGDYVVVETTQGREVGRVAQVLPREGVPAKKRRQYKPIKRRATLEDLVVRESFRLREHDVLARARDLAREWGLRVKIVRASYKYDGSAVTVYYAAEKESGLGKLRTDLAREFETKVELRSVGPRDVAKLMGGCGACGLEQRCCSAFLVSFEPISIRMAKAQDLPLAPAEIAGMCGRLRCCLVYEYDLYKEAGKGLPKLGKQVRTPKGSGRVVERNILKGTVTIATEAGRLVLTREDLPDLTRNAPPISGGCGNCPRKKMAKGGQGKSVHRDQPKRKQGDGQTDE